MCIYEKDSILIMDGWKGCINKFERIGSTCKKKKKKKLSYIVEYMVDSQSAPIHLSILSITVNYTQQLLQKPTNFTFYSP